MTLSAGTHLGPYEILEPLGAGSMGEVYLAKGTRLGRKVGLNLLTARYTKDSSRVGRFGREARAASAKQRSVASSCGKRSRDAGCGRSSVNRCQ